MVTDSTGGWMTGIIILSNSDSDPNTQNTGLLVVGPQNCSWTIQRITHNTLVRYTQHTQGSYNTQVSFNTQHKNMHKRTLVRYYTIQ